MTFLVFLALHLVNLLIVILVSQLNIYFVVVHIAYSEVYEVEFIN